ncbi:hypothetical protein KAI78_10970 [bacterium]|nr:hypothetical protein [bacterium]MCK5600135.1 hypothetical protein [bacterium]
MDRTKFKRIRYSEILTTDNGENYLVMKAESGSKILKPIELSIDQVKVIRSIIGKSSRRNDIFHLLKKNRYLEPLRQLNISDSDVYLLFSSGRKEKIDLVDGIIISLDHGLPIFVGEDHLLLGGIYEYFDDYFDDYDLGSEGYIM